MESTYLVTLSDKKDTTSTVWFAFTDARRERDKGNEREGTGFKRGRKSGKK